MKTILRLLACAALMACGALCQAASDYTTVGEGKAAQVIAVTTSATVTVSVTAESYLIVHLNVSDDSGTASAATDKVSIMNSVDTDGNAVTISTTFAAGFKTLVMAGGSCSLSGQDVPKNSSGVRVIQLKAAGGNARILILRGQ